MPALDTMPARDAELIREALLLLGKDPARRDLDVRKLQPKAAGMYRLRCGRWRALFERGKDSRRIDVLRIDDRKDVYE